MNNKIFYHISEIPLDEGVILTKGLWGGKMRDNQFRNMNYSQYMKEEIFEDVRVSKFSDVPSRMKSVFLTADLSSAKFYRSNWKKYRAHIYEVEVESGEPFIVEMDLLNCNGSEYGIIKSCAEKYWSQQHHPDSCTLEAILDGEAVVRTLISPPSII